MKIDSSISDIFNTLKTESVIRWWKVNERNQAQKFVFKKNFNKDFKEPIF